MASTSEAAPIKGEPGLSIAASPLEKASEIKTEKPKEHNGATEESKVDVKAEEPVTEASSMKEDVQVKDETNGAEMNEVAEADKPADVPNGTKEGPDGKNDIKVKEAENKNNGAEDSGALGADKVADGSNGATDAKDKEDDGKVEEAEGKNDTQAVKSESKEASSDGVAAEKTGKTSREANGTIEKADGKGEGTSSASKDASKSQAQHNSTGRRGGYRHVRGNKKNIKFDPSSLEISSDPDEIKRQVEFYFSDSNLPMDKFLLNQVGGTANRPVKISVIHEFKRMRHFQPYEAVVAALKDSDVLEITDGECIKRKVPLSADILGKSVEEAQRLVEDKTMARSIYAKGFGEETPTTQFDIEAFFASHSPTNAIRLRRTYTQIFKGSVFVEFADEATQKAFLALDPKPKWKGEELLIKSKKQYVDEKAAEIAAGRIRVGEKWEKVDKLQRAKNNDPNNWKKRREEDQKHGFRGDRRGRGHDRGRGGRDRGRGRGQDRGQRSRGGYRGYGGRRDPVDDRDPHTVPKIICTTSDPPSEDETIAPHKRFKSSKPSPPKPKTEPIEETSEKAANGDNGLHTTEPTKAESTAMDLDAASKKRAREDDGKGGQAKKVDTKSDPVATE